MPAAPHSFTGGATAAARRVLAFGRELRLAEAWGWCAVLASSATSGPAFFLPGGLVLLGVLAGVLLGPALSTAAKDRRPKDADGDGDGDA